MISCPSDVTDYVKGNDQQKTVSWTLPTASDNSGQSPALTSDPQYLTASGSFLPGTHSITYTATDTAGNKASCMFSIYVIGKS